MKILTDWTRADLPMFLIDTNVISEIRKQTRANSGVRRFFAQSAKDDVQLYLSVVTIGELRRGVQKIRHRGDEAQARKLETWLQRVIVNYSGSILPIDDEIAQVWGRLRVPHAEHALDKLIAATALIYDLTVVTRNLSDCEPTGVRLLNVFAD